LTAIQEDCKRTNLETRRSDTHRCLWQNDALFYRSLLFKDDYTSYRVAYFLKHKSDVFSKFLQFVKMSGRQTGNKVCRIRSDRGLEFNNEQFRQYINKEGIIQEFNSPYTPEQNGRIERENRSIIEGARTMLFAAGLQPSL